MAKQGMKRPERTHTHPRNAAGPVPELQGRAKRTKARAAPVQKRAPPGAGRGPRPRRLSRPRRARRNVIVDKFTWIWYTMFQNRF